MTSSSFGELFGPTMDTYSYVLHVEEALANLDIFSSSPLYLAVASPVLRQFPKTFGRIPHVYYVLFLVIQTGVLTASCGTKLHCVSAFGSALKVVRTTGLVSVALAGGSPLQVHFRHAGTDTRQRALVRSATPRTLSMAG